MDLKIRVGTFVRSQKQWTLPKLGFREGGSRGLIKRILVATDGSDHANKAIEIASDIAQKYDATIVLLHVVDLLTQRRMALYAEDVGGYFREAGVRILREAEKEVREKGVKSVESRLIEGDPTQEILEFARKNQVHMIVMGRRGTSPLETLLLGSVSQKVCHLAESTCMTVT
jgi:nucleotide-binding universal stress UspA family protein